MQKTHQPNRTVEEVTKEALETKRSSQKQIEAEEKKKIIHEQIINFLTKKSGLRGIHPSAAVASCCRHHCLF
jgi:hypothetical protein